MKQITGNKLLVKALKEEGVDVLFGYPGACTSDSSDELYKQNNIDIIPPRHEQALVHEADAYARTTGKVGVCLVTSGPGATNLVTGLATANYDSVPLVCFTGQVARYLIGNDAFQEVDIVGITRSITKYGVTVRRREDLGRIIKEAFCIARTGRPGPVLIDLPKDVMCELGSAEYPKSVNIQQIIQQMNISADTIVFVDDTAFEREEVKSAIKDITVVDQNEILEYVSLSRFEVPVTEDSKNRRNTYHMMEKQQEEQKAWKGNIDEFLRNCKMQLTIGKPFEDEIQRCYELLQRTNQLNASGRRLELEQVKKYWLSDTFDTSVLVCEDKFGSYGLVGFSIIEKKEIPIIIDFVISCRVANKKVEHSFIKNLAKKSNSGRIRIRYKKTDRNGPIFKVVTDLDMKLVNTEEGFEVYEYLLNSNDISDVVSVVERKWENEN